MPRLAMEDGVASEGAAAIGRTVVAVLSGCRDGAISVASSTPRRVATEGGGGVDAAVASVATDASSEIDVAAFGGSAGCCVAAGLGSFTVDPRWEAFWEPPFART
jgi:hypothetical protein